MAAQATAISVPSPEHRRIAAQHYERARQVLASADYLYGIHLLRTCCRLDPANLIYRQALRQAQRNRLQNKLLGSALAFFTTLPAKARLQAAQWSRNYLDVLDWGERVLTGNPWDRAAQLRMAEAADELGLIDLAVWLLEQARQKNPNDRRVNRPLARLYEKQGNFAQAIRMWDLVSKADPRDTEANKKTKDLAASHTIAKGRYDEAAAGTASRDVVRSLDRSPLPQPEPVAAESRISRKVDQLRAKINADPTNPHPYLQAAKLYQGNHQFDEARQVLEDGLAATGRHFEIQMALAETELEPFRLNLQLTEEKLGAKPKDAALQQARAGLLKEINTRELEIFRQRADRFPTDLGPRLELGIRLFKAEQIDEALRELQQARRDPRNRWRALLYLGYCFKAKNNWALAKRNFEEALQAVPPGEENARKELLFQLAAGAAEQRDWQSAIETGNELANLDFGYQDIGTLVEEWHKQMKGSHAAE